MQEQNVVDMEDKKEVVVEDKETTDEVIKDIDPDKVLPDKVRKNVQAFVDGEQEELSDEDKEILKQKWIDSLTPKQKYLKGFQPIGWRQGFTKPTLEARKASRRIKNKASRKSRKINRKK